MYKQTILFTALIFFTTAGYAADKNIEALQAQLTEAHSKLKVLQEALVCFDNKLFAITKNLPFFTAG